MVLRPAGAQVIGRKGLLRPGARRIGRRDTDLRGSVGGSVNLFRTSTNPATNWVFQGGSFTANAAVAPDGSATATKHRENAGTVLPTFFQSLSGLAVGELHTLKIDFKAAENTFGVLNIQDGVEHVVYFDLTAGVVATKDAALTASIISLGIGWWRCTAAKALSQSTAFAAFRTAEADNVPQFTGTAGNGVYYWHPQFQRGPYNGEYPT